MADLTLLVAFLAGLVSFLSPCVLPVMPGFLSYLAGSTLKEANARRFEIFLNSFFFVLGFSVIFALLGVLLNTVLSAIAYEAQTWLARIGGAIIIFFGLYLTGLIHLPFLEREYKFHLKTKFKSKYLTSFVFGAAFASGWTPCVGAVLGGILGLAASNPGSSFLLLFSYSLGLGLPFLLLGAFAAQGAQLIQKFAKYLRIVNIVFGVLLIVIGVLAFTQNLDSVANFDLLN
ncbi:MAG: cytochrome c biogenesis protein CcdA, partial [Patescibacteria group bacterium]